MEHIKQFLKIECEKLYFGSIYCSPILNKLTNVIDIGNEADATRICSYILLCPKQPDEFNEVGEVVEVVEVENEQSELSTVRNSKLTQSTANMNISAGHVCFSLFFIVFFKNYVIGL